MLKFLHKPVQRRTLIAVIAVMGVLLVSLSIAYGATVAQNSYKAVYGERVLTDEGMSVGNTGIDISMGDASAVDNVEMVISPYGSANTALTNNNWEYNVDVYESAVDSITSGSYTVKLYLNGILQGTITITQSAADAGNIEGVTCTFDLGSDLPGDMTILIKISAV